MGLRRDIDRVLVSEEIIRKRVRELGMRITEDYRSRNLMMVGMLNGATVFVSDLMRRIDLPLRLDFACAESYGAGAESGEMRWRLDLAVDIRGYDLLIVEDIVDTGRTMNRLLERLEGRSPSSIKICTLLDKPRRRICPVKIDYAGFEIPDCFAVGYGLDFAGLYRNLPFVGALKAEMINRNGR